MLNVGPAHRSDHPPTSHSSGTALASEDGTQTVPADPPQVRTPLIADPDVPQNSPCVSAFAVDLSPPPSLPTSKTGIIRFSRPPPFAPSTSLLGPLHPRPDTSLPDAHIPRRANPDPTQIHPTRNVALTGRTKRWSEPWTHQHPSKIRVHTSPLTYCTSFEDLRTMSRTATPSASAREHHQTRPSGSSIHTASCSQHAKQLKNDHSQQGWSMKVGEKRLDGQKKASQCSNTKTSNWCNGQ